MCEYVRSSETSRETFKLHSTLGGSSQGSEFTDEGSHHVENQTQFVKDQERRYEFPRDRRDCDYDYCSSPQLGNQCGFDSSVYCNERHDTRAIHPSK
ncbi:hypothetical protein GE061_014930 [Apolygus lucorum]|uniref:Uncharacterized protein n=1 Tax=Apolygus lucorum TaxID=248454 RepID=A0A8S9XNM7_APOLU|nr:hypothetical protein GE061_014930 [Apolygus lucorum]